MVITSAPAYLHAEEVLDIHDQDLRSLMLNPPQLPNQLGYLHCGKPHPTIRGLMASIRRDDEDWFEHRLEIFRNGYMEFGRTLDRVDNPLLPEDLGLYFTSIGDMAYAVNFLRLAAIVCERWLPMTPASVSMSIYNARGMWLYTNASYGRKIVWQDQHLELGKFYAENLPEERKLLQKSMGDRLWQAFHRDKSEVFDDEGTFKTQ